MEKIYFDDSTYIWKAKLSLTDSKPLFIKEAYSVIESQPNVTQDGFAYRHEWHQHLDFIGDIEIERNLDEIVQIGINKCKEIYNEKNINYNKINTESWVNVVRSRNPVQDNFYTNNKFHTHTEINKKHKQFIPLYTYVYYIQMPDIMEGEDGVLYLRGKNKKEYWIRPEEDDLIIMEAEMPHAPNSAPNATINRIVIAGNVGFENIKKTKSLI